MKHTITITKTNGDTFVLAEGVGAIEIENTMSGATQLMYDATGAEGGGSFLSSHHIATITIDTTKED